MRALTQLIGLAALVITVVIATWLFGLIALMVGLGVAVVVLVGAGIRAEGKRARWVLVSSAVLLVAAAGAVWIEFAGYSVLTVF
jgi:hypothetical protein